MLQIIRSTGPADTVITAPRSRAAKPGPADNRAGAIFSLILLHPLGAGRVMSLLQFDPRSFIVARLPAALLAGFLALRRHVIGLECFLWHRYLPSGTGAGPSCWR